MSGRHRVLLAAQNIVFGVKRLDRSLGPILTKMTNHDRHEDGDPHQSEHYQQHLTDPCIERLNIEVKCTAKC
jgi:hypothetical protein